MRRGSVVRLGRVMGRARVVAGLSQLQLAVLLGVGEGTVADWEAGWYWPLDAVVVRWCAAVGVDPQVVVGGGGWGVRAFGG